MTVTPQPLLALVAQFESLWESGNERGTTGDADCSTPSTPSTPSTLQNQYHREANRVRTPTEYFVDQFNFKPVHLR